MVLGSFKWKVKPSWDHRNALLGSSYPCSTGKAANSDLDLPDLVLWQGNFEDFCADHWMEPMDIWDGTPTATQDLSVSSQHWLILHSGLEYLFPWIHSWTFLGDGGRISALHLYILNVSAVFAVICLQLVTPCLPLAQEAFISSRMLNCLFWFPGTCVANIALPHNSECTGSVWDCLWDDIYFRGGYK